MYPLIFQLINRVVGVQEWTDSNEISARAFSRFCSFERNCSKTRMVFPYLITLTHVKKLFYGALLHMSISEAVKKRDAGEQNDDAIKFLLDHDKDVVKVGILKEYRDEIHLTLVFSSSSASSCPA